MTRRTSLPTAKFVTGDGVFAGWRDDVLTGTAPILFPHTLPVPEISPGAVVLLGGAPGAGKTALVMQCVVEALRHTPTLRALVANVEMPPAALFDRQLARLSGIEAEVIRHRRFTAEHAERLDAGLATIESFAERLAFLTPPFDLSNVAAAADAHRADLILLDYLQRILPPGDVADPRLRANAVMGWLRQFADAGCGVLALSAVGRSRDAAGRSTYAAGSMSLASFRDSGELEYGADDAFLLAPVDDADPNVVRLSHLKCRHGAQRTIDLHFDRPRQAFTLLDDAVDARPASKPARGKRGRQPKGATPHPEFSPEQLAALWKSTPAAPADAVADDADDGGTE
jgi:replicative DNA helicase